MEDQLVLMYVKDGNIHPVAMTGEQQQMLQLLGKTFEPIKVIKEPIGEAVNLIK